MSIPRKRSSIVFRITNTNVLVVLSDKIGCRPAADTLTELEGPGAVSNPKYQWYNNKINGVESADVLHHQKN